MTPRKGSMPPSQTPEDSRRIRELRRSHPDVRSLADLRALVLRRDEPPTTEELWAANCMTADEYAAAWDAYRIERDAEAAGRVVADAEAEAARLRRRTEAAGVPARYRSVALDLTRLHALAGGGNLWVHGARGSGKTWLASATLRGWLSRNPDGRPLFVTSPDLVTEAVATYDGEGSEAEVIGRYGSCPLLVLDDLGKENPTANALRVLWQVVDMRSRELLPTVVTSQFNAGDAIVALGRGGERATAEAIVSRLSQRCEPVYTGATDRRTAGR